MGASGLPPRVLASGPKPCGGKYLSSLIKNIYLNNFKVAQTGFCNSEGMC